MSIKIYNGLKHAPVSGPAIHELMDTISNTVTPVIQAAHDKRLGEDIFATIDAISTNTRPPIEIDPEVSLMGNIGGAWHRRARDMEATTRERAPLDDFTFDASFYFGAEETLIVPICEVRGVRESLLEVPGIEDYGYWNNSDQPEELNDEQWSERRKSWLIATDDKAQPLVMHLDQSRFWFGSYERAIATIPSREERIDRVAKNSAINERLNGVKIDASNVFAVMRETRDWLETDEGQEQFNRYRDLHDAQIIRVDITVDLLNEMPGSFADIPCA